MKKYIVLSSVVCAMALATATRADPGFRGGGPDRGGPERGLGAALENDELAQKLGITEEQRDKLRESHFQGKQEVIKLQADRDLAQLELRRLLSEDSPDSAAVMKAVEQVGRIETDIQKAHVSQMLVAREILGADTFKKLRANFRESRGRQGEGPRGPGEGRREYRGERSSGGGPGSGEKPRWHREGDETRQGHDQDDEGGEEEEYKEGSEVGD